MSATVTMIKKREAISQLDYICGGCLFTHAANFKKIGLLPEEYFLYWEEADWCYRAKQMGYKFCICNEAVCYDKMSAIIGKGFLSDYYYARNGLIFISKYRKKNIPIVLIATVMRFFKRVFSGKWQRARGVFRGTIDFFKLKPDEI